MYKTEYEGTEVIANIINNDWKARVNSHGCTNRSAYFTNDELKRENLTIRCGFDLIAHKIILTLCLKDEQEHLLSDFDTELYKVTLSDNTWESIAFAIDHIFAYADQVILISLEKKEVIRLEDR